LHIRSGRSGGIALSTAAPLARSPFRLTAFAIGRGPRVIGRVLAADLLTALDVATLQVHLHTAAGAAALFGEERLER
jgi:hypothetical protein